MADTGGGWQTRVRAADMGVGVINGWWWQTCSAGRHIWWWQTRVVMVVDSGVVKHSWWAWIAATGGSGAS